MVSYRYPIIAREGWPLIFAFLLLATALLLFAGLVVSLPAWGLLFFVMFAYRDPARTVPSAPLAIVAPVDGEVIKIEEVQDRFIDRTAKRIVIDMHMFDIHSTHSPTEGKVMKQWHSSGDGSSKQKGEASSGAKFAQWVQTDEGDDVVLAVKQHAHLQKPRCYVQSGERIGQGQRCGYIPSAATVEVLVPTASRIDIHEGDTIRAGSDIIATLIH